MRVETGEGETIPDDVGIEVRAVVKLDEGRADEAGEEGGRGFFQGS
jgi:hypothetical protein